MSPRRSLPAKRRIPFHACCTPYTAQMIDRLDAQHEELIGRLDELNAQIEAALAEFGRSPGAVQPGDDSGQSRVIVEQACSACRG